MVGIPDGLGAYDDGDGTFTVLMNHELGSSSGVARAHGSKGAFVSKWTIRKDDLSVVSGQDLISTVYLWQGGAYVAGTNASGQVRTLKRASRRRLRAQNGRAGGAGATSLGGVDKRRLSPRAPRASLRPRAA
jgi:hypothetical protein